MTAPTLAAFVAVDPDEAMDVRTLGLTEDTPRQKLNYLYGERNYAAYGYRIAKVQITEVEK